MALKITLKPHERMILAGAVVTNGSAKSSFFIENNVPLLREKDIMREGDANSPAQRIYFVIQLMYVDEKNLIVHHNSYWNLVKDLVQAAPSTLGLIDRISEYILGNHYYKALKLCRKLMEYEKEVLNSVQKSNGSI